MSPRCFFGRLLGFDPLHPDAVSWYRRALGERRVGTLLAQLGGDWRVLHAVPRGDADAEIDHLVIGPPGVITITSASRRHGPLAAQVASAEQSASVASRALSRATAVPVIADAIVLVERASVLREAVGVAVVPPTLLLRHLRGLPAALAPDVVASVARAAEEWTTWWPLGVGVVHSDPDDAFAQLHAEVASARRRRTAWRLAGVAAVAGAVFGVASSAFA